MKTIISILALAVSTSFSQVDLDVQITPYVKYYITSIDPNTGQSTVPLFSGTLSREPGTPDSVSIVIESRLTIYSETLELYNEDVVSIKTDPFWLRGAVIINNTDLNLDTREIYDVFGNRVELSVSSENVETIDFVDAEALASIVVQTGRLPNGIYKVSVAVWDENESYVIDDEEVIVNISDPSYLQLMSPGGILADTTLNEIFTTFPVLQWESDPCNIPGGCEYFIRVAEFEPEIHSSVDEAIESTTRLPLDQAEGWAYAGNGVTSFQYPTTGVGSLEMGKIYVWQVKKTLETTSGPEEGQSNIFAFKIKDLSITEEETTEGGGTTENTQLILTVQSLVGNDVYNSFFDSGNPFENYSLTGVITQNGITIDLSDLQNLISQGIAETDSIGAVQYRPLEIISVEVVE